MPNVAKLFRHEPDFGCQDLGMSIGRQVAADIELKAVDTNVAVVAQLQNPAHLLCEELVLQRQIGEEIRQWQRLAGAIRKNHALNRNRAKNLAGSLENRLTGASQPVFSITATLYPDLIGDDGFQDRCHAVQVHGVCAESLPASKVKIG